MIRAIIVVTLTLMSVGAAAWAAAGKGRGGPPVLSWAGMLDRVASDPALAEARNELVEQAREVVATPIVQRAHGLEDVGKHRTWLDGRSNVLEDEIRETFALAMSDYAATNTVARELPLLAGAYRLTGEPEFRDRAVAQLEEMATWSPLQRPGWTLYAPGNRLPEDGKDGNWLATGMGVRAIGDALDLLPADAVPAELSAKLRALLEAEVAGVVDDWQVRRSWFISSDNPVTNQWVLPTEGLVRACLILGVEGREDAYELGVANLLKALDAHGAQGEFEEGFGYAAFTVTSMLHTAHAMAAADDRRAIDHPFLANFPTWFVHHFQPGDMVINCFDAGGAYGAAKRMRPLLSLSAACTGSPVARWALEHQVGGPSMDLAGLACRGLPPIGPEAAPPLFAYYERATRVNWRDSWEPDASGVWVRGGHALDQHDHQDRGHVNYIARGKPILIEAGTPSYHHPLMPTHYASGVGHNVLQLGTIFPKGYGDPGGYAKYPGWQKVHTVAPITVRRLGAEGGDIEVDGTACYNHLSRWRRMVTWSADELSVADNVALAKGQVDVVVFRWHLGTEEEVSIERGAEGYNVSWHDAELRITATSPIALSQTTLPDQTLPGHTGEDDPANTHTCIVVQSATTVAAITIETRVTPR